MKKGWDAGKAAVARAGDDEPETAAPAAGETPAEKPAVGGAQPALTGGPTAGLPPATEPVGGPTAQPTAGDVNKAGPAGTAAAKPLQGQAKVAADKTAAATAGQDQSAAGQTMYAQVKANIDKLDKKGKQRILQLLQKSMAAPAGGAEAGGTTTKDQAGAGAMGAMASQLGAGEKPANTMANTPVSATNTAKPGNPNAAPADPAAAAPADPAAAADDLFMFGGAGDDQHNAGGEEEVELAIDSDDELLELAAAPMGDGAVAAAAAQAAVAVQEDVDMDDEELLELAMQGNGLDGGNVHDNNEATAAADDDEIDDDELLYMAMQG
jgi:hypothetical protein